MTTLTDVFMMTWGISFAIILFFIFKRIIHFFSKYDKWLHSIFLNLLSLQQWVSVTTVVGKMMVKVGIGNSSSIVIVFAFSFAFHFRSARWWNKKYWQLAASTRHIWTQPSIKTKQRGETLCAYNKFSPVLTNRH